MKEKTHLGNRLLSVLLTFLMLLSLEPAISQESSTSHSATWCASSIARFCSGVSGTGTQNSAASTRQKRFCGCP